MLSQVAPKLRLTVIAVGGFITCTLIGITPFDGVTLPSIFLSGLFWLFAALLPVIGEGQEDNSALLNSFAASLAVLAGFAAMHPTMHEEWQKTRRAACIGVSEVFLQGGGNCIPPANSARQSLPPSLSGPGNSVPAGR